MADRRQAGQSEMYRMKPLHQVGHIETPTTMYHMKRLNANADMATDPDMKTLMEKDRRIANDLVALSEEVKELSWRLGHTFGEPGHGVAKQGGNLSLFGNKPFSLQLPEGITDLVISTSLSKPAFSAVLIGEFLKSNGVNVAMVTQIHSSLVSSVPENYFAITGGLNGRIGCVVEQLVFTFMWKDNAVCPALMHSPKLQTRIVGDANIARYLCRLLCPLLYNEDDIDAVVEIDRWIETSVQLCNGSSKEKDSALKAMNAHLGKNDYFCNGQLTLADIALLGALLANTAHAKSLPKNLKKWFQTMSDLFKNTMGRFEVPITWTLT